MKFKHQTTGYSLIEVMIAVSILMIAVVAPMTIAIKSIQSSRYTLEQNTATFLAQESVSIIEGLRNHYAINSIYDGTATHWDWTDAFSVCESEYGCNFDASDLYNIAENSSRITTCEEDGETCRLYYDASLRSAYHLGSDSGDKTPFVRRVYVTHLDDNEMTVQVDVEWDTVFLGKEQRVTLTSSFFNLYSRF